MVECIVTMIRVDRVEGWDRGMEYGSCEMFLQGEDENDVHFWDGISVSESRNGTLDPDFCDYGWELRQLVRKKSCQK